MKTYPPEIKYHPLGLRPEMVMGMSRILEDKINEYMAEFPKRIRKYPASINNGAITFKLYDLKGKKNEKQNF
jgi:hypothetical protein